MILYLLLLLLLLLYISLLTAPTLLIDHSQSTVSLLIRQQIMESVSRGIPGFETLFYEIYS
jgi:hypothetical protein